MKNNRKKATFISLNLLTLFLAGCGNMYMFNAVWYDGVEGKKSFHQYLEQAQPLAVKYGVEFQTDFYSKTETTQDFNPDVVFIARYPSLGGMLSVLSNPEFQKILELREKGAKRSIWASCDIDESLPKLKGSDGVFILNIVDLKRTTSYKKYRELYLKPMLKIAKKYYGGLATAIYLPKTIILGSMDIDAEVIFVQRFLDLKAYSAFKKSREFQRLEFVHQDLVREKMAQQRKNGLF